MTVDSDNCVSIVDDPKVKSEQSDYALEKQPEGHDMTKEEEARMVRKLDLHIFPILVCLYMLSFLDRVNIGK